MVRLATAALAIGAVGLVACGDDDRPASAPAPSAALTGTQWALATGDLGIDGADGVTSWIRFDGAQVVGNDGCNQFTGGYTAHGSELDIGPLAGTRKACPGAAGEVAARVTSALDRVAAYEIAGKTLRLHSAAGDELLAYRATVPSPEGRWEAVSVLYDDAIRSVIIDTSLTADFAGDGHVSGSGGCNSFSGSYEASGSKLRIGPLAATQRACAESDRNEQEQGYFAALESARSFEQIGDQLTLLNAKGQMAVTFARTG